MRKNESRMHLIDRAAHRNSRQKILESLKKDFGIEKKEAVVYLDNYCTKKVVDHKTIYEVLSISGEDSKMSVKSNKSNKSKRSKKASQSDS